MKKSTNYVFSVSAGTGCYRHIAISATATLFDLHQSILSAFQFSDDEAHVFFMDNRLWSDQKAYTFYPDVAKETPEVKLNQLDLTVGSGFKYVLDGIAQWIFRCKFLRETQEDVSGVIRTKGDAPTQFSLDLMEENGIFPLLFSDEIVDKILEESALPAHTRNLLERYFASATNLYGIAPLGKVFEIYNQQNPPISQEDFIEFAVINSHKKHLYALLKESNIYDNVKHSAPMEWQLVSEYLYYDELEGYVELNGIQSGKAFYVPEKQDLLRFDKDDYIEKTPQSQALYHYLMKKTWGNSIISNDILEELAIITRIDDCDFAYVVQVAERLGLLLASHNDACKLYQLFCDMSNHIRKPIHRGYTFAELQTFLSHGESAISSFGEDIQKMLADGADAQDLFMQIMQMDFPEESIRTTLLSALRETIEQQTPTAPPKVGRNEPCPCGSGKKYKRCCGA